MRRLLLILLLAALPAGCGGGPLLRDHYLGKSWLQPDKVAHPVERDALGNPILDDRPPVAGRGE